MLALNPIISGLAVALSKRTLQGLKLSRNKGLIYKQGPKGLMLLQLIPHPPLRSPLGMIGLNETTFESINPNV